MNRNLRFSYIVFGVMKKILHHYFVPHVGNNFRAKLLHNSTLLVIAVMMLVVGFSAASIHRNHPDVLGISYDISSSNLLAITNKDRTDNGLPPLNLSNELTQAAEAKAADMFAKNYWAHFAPDGSTTPWMFIKEAGYAYVYAGENLAKGYTTSADVVQAWMNSPSHRENMLSKNYNDVGFAVVPGRLQDEDTVLVVEMFGSTQAEALDANSHSNNTQVQSALAPPPKLPAAAVTITPVPQITVALHQLAQKSLPVTQEKPETSYIEKPLFDASSISTGTVFIVLGLLIIALTIDIIIVERKKVPRFVGHNIDHILLIGLFLLLIILQRAGAIL